MARTDKYSIQKGTLDDIADAIREKRGHSNSMSPTAMPEEIRAIKSGGTQIAVGFDKGIVKHGSEVWYYGNNLPDQYGSVTDYIAYTQNWYYDQIANFYYADLLSYYTGNDNSGILLLYQVSSGYSAATPWIGVHVEADGNWKISRYTVSSSGNTTLDNSNVYNYSGSATFRKNLTIDNNNQNAVDAWVITGENIKFFGFATSTSQSSTSKANNDQPCIFKLGDLPQVESLYSEPGSTDPTKYCWSTKHLVYERVEVGYDSPNCMDIETASSTGVKNVKNAWKDSYSLLKVDTQICSTPTPELYADDAHTFPLDASHLFENCYNLRYVSLGSIFSNWVNNYNTAPIADMSYMFANCYMLKTIVLDGSQIDGSVLAFFSYASFESDEILGAPVSLSHFCDNCYSLEKIESGALYAGDIVFGDFSYAFNNCYSLTDINCRAFIPESYNASYITSFSHMFANCYSLTTIDIKMESGAYSNLSAVDYMFYNCKSLTNFGPKGSSPVECLDWYTGEVLENYNGVSNFDHMFDGCTSLTTMCIPFTLARHPSGLVSMSYMFANCNSLETVGFTEWSYLVDQHSTFNNPTYPFMTNDKVKDISYMFYNCWSLKYAYDAIYGNRYAQYRCSFDLSQHSSGWDICVWDHAFENCYSLEVLDLHNWANTYQHVYPDANCNYTVTYTDVFKNMYKLRTLSLPNRMNISYGQTGMSLINCPGLIRYYGYQGAYLSHGYYGCDNLARGSLVSCIEALEMINATQTLTIGSINLAKLSASDIAIATQKGWTVA